MSFETIVSALARLKYHTLPPALLQERKERIPLPEGIYPQSLFSKDGTLYAMARMGEERKLLLLSSTPGALPPFEGHPTSGPGWIGRICPLTVENALLLRQQFAWLNPVSLADRPATIGCGDRLGRATTGQLRAIRKFAVAPVLAQQSMRELTLTRRTFVGVLSDAVWGVFQAGYTEGFGADADHLKTLTDIQTAIDAGYTMITLDLSAVLRPEAASFSDAEIATEFERLAEPTRRAILNAYADRPFQLDGETLTLSASEVRRCAVLYTAALDFAKEVFDLLVSRRGVGRFDLEISVDETTTPTLPSHHLFFIRELRRRGVEIVSLAPRFIGEFQKGIDYIGDLETLAEAVAQHAAIAREFGHKLGIHSGSDKFAAFPLLGEAAGDRLHVKTAGTSWLEAVRVVAATDPPLFRAIWAAAAAGFPRARQYYHIRTHLAEVAEAAAIPDAELPALLDQDAPRQFLHITYGEILRAPAAAGGTLGDRLRENLAAHEERYAAGLEAHFRRHLESLGLPARCQVIGDR